MVQKYNRHEVRDLAWRFKLGHSTECRKANGVLPKGHPDRRLKNGRFPFHCECSFMKDIEDARNGRMLVCRKAVCKNRVRRSDDKLPEGWTASMFPDEYYCSSTCRNEIEGWRDKDGNAG